MKLTDFDVLTFDCYGTLIDWEGGIYAACQPLLARNGVERTRDEILEQFAKCESAHEAATPDLIYPQVLERTHRDMARHWGLDTDAGLDQAFGESVPQWPSFDDSAESLQYLAEHYKLVILSNVDHKSFAASNVKLKVVFNRIFTAEDIGSYKPNLHNFDFMLKQLGNDGIAPDQVLHTAQSLFHDHVPAGQVGLKRCWIDRRMGVDGTGATAAISAEADVDVDFHFPSMAALVDAHKAAIG